MATQELVARAILQHSHIMRDHDAWPRCKFSRKKLSLCLAMITANFIHQGAGNVRASNRRIAGAIDSLEDAGPDVFDISHVRLLMET